MAAYEFAAMLKFSRGRRESTDLETIRKMIPGCLSVEKTGERLDRLHVDYVAHLRKGAVLHIDAKARQAGAAQFWIRKRKGRGDIPNGEPDLALEIWSKKPERCGWTLDESSDTDLILFTFDPEETEAVFLVSFPLLRIAFRQQLKVWTRRFGIQPQQTPDRFGKVLWESECVFIPAVIVQKAIREVERGTSAAYALTAKEVQ